MENIRVDVLDSANLIAHLLQSWKQLLCHIFQLVHCCPSCLTFWGESKNRSSEIYISSEALSVKLMEKNQAIILACTFTALLLYFSRDLTLLLITLFSKKWFQKCSIFTNRTKTHWNQGILSPMSSPVGVWRFTMVYPNVEKVFGALKWLKHPFKKN